MKLDRQGLVEAAIAGAATGVFFGCVVIAAKFTTDPSDILGFFGAAFGAAAAVSGALFVEHVKLSKELCRKRDSLESAIAAVIMMHEGVINHPKENEIIPYMISVDQALAVFLRRKEAYETKDLKLVATLEALSYYAPITQARIKETIRQFDDGEILLETVEMRGREIATRGIKQWLRALTEFDQEWSGDGIRLLRNEAPHLL